MNTKILMTTTAVAMAITGIILTFAPEEVSKYLNLTGISVIFLQLMGALYFGFGILNWTAKASVIGGIYGKAISMGNFSHFLAGGMALVRPALNSTGFSSVRIAAIIYVIFAVLFGYVSFTNPAAKNKTA